MKDGEHMGGERQRLTDEFAVAVAVAVAKTKTMYGRAVGGWM